MSPVPPVISRPPFADWLFARNIKPADAASALRCSKQTIINICKPFDAKGRTVPHEALMERIFAYTGGMITAGDWYPPHLRRKSEDLVEARA